MAKFHKTHKRLAKVTPPWRGACYEIDGEHFDADGEPVDVKSDMTDIEYDEAVKRNKGRPFKAEPRPEPETVKETPNIPPELTHEDVDLEAWALGNQEVSMALVKEAIADRYGVKATNRDRCLRVLVEENIVTAEQVGLE